MSVQAYLVSYDISDNKERYRVEKTVSDYAQRIQYSVFYAVLNQHHLQKLQKQLQTLHIKTGNVFITSINPASWQTIGVNTFNPNENWAFTLV